jgi:hypothetical protein
MNEFGMKFQYSKHGFRNKYQYSENISSKKY